MTLRVWMLACVLWAAAMPAMAADEAAWLQGLYDDVAADLQAGKPLVVHAHIPLCDNRVIRCGRHGLGNGDDPDRNLYWRTSGGFRGWFGRRGSGWKQVAQVPAQGDVLETRVWKRRFRPTRAWRKRGVTRAFDVYVVAEAWRGLSIQGAMATYVSRLGGHQPRSLKLSDGTVVAAGGDARVVAFVGHNGWMDVDRYDWGKRLAKTDQRKRGAIAIACATAPYMADTVSSPQRVPVLMTATLLFAGAHGFEGTVRSFARAGSYRQIRASAAKAYGTGQGKSWKRVISAFTNPGDKRWRRYRKP